MLDDSQILKLAQDELSDSESVMEANEEELGYFNCQLPPPIEAEEGEEPWTDVVSPDVRNAVIATMAEIIPGFTSDMPAEFDPMSPEDEAQAAEESRVVTHVIFTACSGYELIIRAIQSLLLHKVGVLEVMWDSRKVVTGERLEGLPAQQLALMEQQGMRFGGGVDRGDGSYDVDVITETKRNEPRVEFVPASELRVGAGHKLTNMDEARFIARQRTVQASDLVAMGLQKAVIDDLTSADGEIETEDKSARQICINTCYMYIDTDGDGIAELRRVILGGGPDGQDQVLENRPWDSQPFCVGVPYFSPDSWEGISLFERLKFVQDVKTDLTRQVIETGWRNLVQRLWGVERLYNYDQLQSSRRGGVVDVKDANAIGALPDVPLNPLSMSLLEMVDKMRREAGGGAIDTAPQVQEMGGDTAHGLERMMSAIEQTNAMVAKNIAETLVSQLYIKVHRMLRKHWQGVIMARKGKSWIQQAPTDWQERSDVSVSVGLSTGDRQRQAASLASIIAQQIAAAERGQDGVLVALPQIHNALIDYARMIGLNSPEQYWIDPASEEGQQAAQAKQQQMEQQKQEAAAAAQQQVDLIKEVEEIKAGAKRYSDDLGHVQQVNSELVRVLELSAKYSAQDVADFKDFRDALSKPMVPLGPLGPGGLAQPNPEPMAGQDDDETDEVGNEQRAE